MRFLPRWRHAYVSMCVLCVCVCVMNVNHGFIAVHVGAGKHSEALKEKYQKLCRQACKSAIKSLKAGRRPVDAVCEAVTELEDSPLTNAGFGSNLTLEGNVECDASVMDGNTLHFGAVGAVNGIRNPVLLAKKLCECQAMKIAFGRIPPSFLVGDGAKVWAREMGVETLPPEQLISAKAEKMYKHYKRKVEDSGEEVHKVSKQRMDTVGAVCVDGEGNVASACSSGGIILKYPGRVGQAGMWGCGAWASKGSVSVATSTSGCGEHLIRTTLARTVAEKIANDACPITGLHRAMENEFLNSRFLDGLEQKLGGVVAIRYSPQEGSGDFLWSHSTNSMIVGYMNSNDQTATSHMAVLPSQEVGRKTTVEGICFKLN
ncbi:threonine aspartase 1 [Ceratina calcarata]|uniref:Threonine aspartase 1 n=1 Tax=Ceratina calcarata TaxID=156304 RepID=A0AAJ7NAG7_9HYME|nr:threonine aspartase 1 [Ceratina calcarata]